MSSLHICVDGGIGVGKSSLLDRLASHLKTHLNQDIDVLYEPVDEWRSYGPQNENLLEKMYVSPKDFSFTFQTAATVTKIEQLQNRSGILLVERSLDSQLQVFIPVLALQNSINLTERSILEQQIAMFRKLDPTLIPDLVIYLRTSPKRALERIQKRGRYEEGQVSLQYLEMIHKEYDNWLTTTEEYPVIVIPFDDHFTNSDVVDLAKKIKDFPVIKDVLQYSALRRGVGIDG